MAPRYRHLGITLLADSLYAVHPFVDLARIAHQGDRHGVEFVVICIW